MSDDPRNTSIAVRSDSISLLGHLPPRWRIVIWFGTAVIVIQIFIVVAILSRAYVVSSVNDAQDLSRIEGIQLKELVRKVKADLTEADQEAAAKGELALFRLQEFQLDINVVASGSAETKGQLMTVGGNVSIGNEKIQKIHLRWTVDPEYRTIRPMHDDSIGEPTISVDAE